MAAELSISTRTGIAEMFTVRMPAWHRDGHVWEVAPTFEEAMGIVDYPVEKRPTFRAILGANDEVIDYVENTTAFITYRTDTGKELGNVGPQYEPMRNRKAFQAIVPLLDSGLMVLETGGVLRDGADAWILGRFDIERFGPIVREVFADEVIPYALLTNNHNGRRSATVAETPVRVVCANTLGYAEHLMDEGQSRHVKVQHSGDAELRMTEAAQQLFGALVERYEVIAAAYRQLKARILTEAEYRTSVLDQVAPRPQDQARFNPDAKLAELVVERAEKKRRELTRLWTEGDGHKGDHSAWEGYNAAVQAIDHNTELFPTRDGTYRTASLMAGRLGDMKKGVLLNLTRLATLTA